ncbi:MAG: hypothetical protein H6667_06215, partial [Ardenticatenaceae bacterium]|nr:hypothetical protein [Ardenticatenaceae bacterium]
TANEPPVVAGTPPPVGEGTAVAPTEQSPINPPVATNPSGTAVPNLTPAGTPSPTNPGAIPSATELFTNGTITPASTATNAAPSGTTTPTATPIAGATTTAGPTPTGSTLSTSTPAPTPIDIGPADPEEPLMDFLNGGELHQWAFDNEVINNSLTVQVVPSAQADIILTVYDPNGVQIVNQNNTGTGLIETITDLNLPGEGLYNIVLTDKNKVGGDYAMMILDSFSFNITLHQIDYGAPQTTSFTDNEEQIWFFDGSEDDLLTITAVPTTGTPDIGFELIGPFAEPLEYIDEFFESSDPEVLSDYILTETGLYGVWLFGVYDGTMSVRLSVEN